MATAKILAKETQYYLVQGMALGKGQAVVGGWQYSTWDAHQNIREGGEYHKAENDMDSYLA